MYLKHPTFPVSRMGFLWLIFIMLFLGCKKGKQSSIQFYHWQSYLDITPQEFNYLEQLHSETLYLRYFDVGIENGERVPMGKMVKKIQLPESLNIIPTIFITNETFSSISDDERKTLAGRTAQLIQKMHQDVSSQSISRVQFDCDWSATTREAYFAFLKEIKEKTDWNISVTIRLHQVKYDERTGIPPADHFVLMCYNTGKVGDMKEGNSILETEVVKQYIRNSDYPYELDVALPLFSWAVVYRDGQLIKLIRQTDMATFKDNPKYSLGKQWVEVLESTYLNGYYLYQGDRLRLETSERTELDKTVRYLNDFLHPENIIFYHLDSTVIKQYEYEYLESLSQHFTHY